MEIFLNEGIEVKLLNFEVGKNANIINRSKELFKYLISIPKSIKYIRKFNSDIIHVHWTVTQYIAKIYKLIYKKPFITILHTKNTKRSILHQKPDEIISISQIRC